MSNAPQDPQSQNPPRRGSMNLWFFVIILLAIGMFYVSAFNTADKIDKSAFETYVTGKRVERVDIGDNRLTGKFIDPPPLKPPASSPTHI